MVDCEMPASQRPDHVVVMLEGRSLPRAARAPVGRAWKVCRNLLQSTAAADLTRQNRRGVLWPSHITRWIEAAEAATEERLGSSVGQLGQHAHLVAGSGGDWIPLVDRGSPSRYLLCAALIRIHELNVRMFLANISRRAGLTSNTLPGPFCIHCFLSRLTNLLMKPARRVWPWQRMFMANICIHYKDRLDGGGSAYAKDYRAYLGNRGMPKQARTFEWCAGPGFIGFSLLGAGLTETLCLADINPEAVAACRRSIKDNALAARVNVYQSDNLANVPQSE